MACPMGAKSTADDELERKRKYHREYNRARRAANPGIDKAACKKWRAKNKEYDSQRTKEWKRENVQAVRDYQEIWKAENPDYHAKWRAKNPLKTRQYSASYRIARERAKPAWAVDRLIAAIYMRAVMLTKLTGIPHEVDHVVPLKGKNVCGLHTHQNLRAIPSSQNRAKGNRFHG